VGGVRSRECVQCGGLGTGGVVGIGAGVLCVVRNETHTTLSMPF